MITRLQTGILAEHITKKQSRRFRAILHEIYDIISQGANAINEIRYSVCATQDAHIRHEQRVLESVKNIGQRLIVDYLLNSRGLTGNEMHTRRAGSGR